MVKKFLKIAGVKNEKEFYDKYPSEAAFFKAHPEARSLKQYKQGGQTKKLNQLTSYQGDIDETIPVAQDGYGCKGKSCTQTGEGIFKVGAGMTPDGTGKVVPVVPLSNAPVTWEELQTYNETNPKSKEFKNRLKTLQVQFPGLTQQQLLAAGADSARIKQRINDLPKWDKPENQTYDRNWYPFYRNLMKPGSPVTVEQILQMHQGRPGGLGGYQQTVQGNYKQQDGGETAPIGSYMSSPTYQTKMLDFSSYMNPVDKMVTGSTQAERDAAAAKQAESKQDSGSGGGGIGNILGMASQFMGKGRNGIRKAQGGTYTFPGAAPGSIQNPDPNAQYMWGNPTLTGSGTSTPMNPNAPLTYDISAQTGYDPNARPISSMNGPDKKPFNPLKGIPIAGQIIGGIQQIKEAKKQEKEANKQFQLSGLTKRAALSRPEPIKRKYVRPEDQAINENELFPTYGVGTNYIAQDGAEVTGQIGGNETEVQNLYNPYNLYEDLGYEPLDESEKIKRYQGGGLLSGSQFGQLGSGIGAMVGGGGQGSPAGWSQALGGVGSIFGPVGGMVGNIVGSVIDGRQQAKTKYFQDRAQKNVVDTAMQQGMQGIQSQYGNVLQNGGYLSHDWQPQVIASFGGNRVSDLLRPDPTMNTLRTGGHITQNQDDNDMGPVTSMAMGGELKTHWGGYAEPMSYNPYLPEGGETVMFRGQSHDESDGQGNTGIGVTYGESPVEVERNEPAIKMRDGSTGEDNMVVYGNLKIPNQFLEAIGDPKAKGKKFKHYVADLSKQEEKLNRQIEKNLNIIDETDDVTSFDQLKFFSAKANIDGANAKLKQIAEYKMNAAAVQNAINDAAEEHGLEADALAKGKFKVDKKAFQDMAKWGKSIAKLAQNGTTTASSIDKAKYDEIKQLYAQAKAEAKRLGKNRKGPIAKKLQEKFHEYFPEIAEKIIIDNGSVTGKAKSEGYDNIDDLVAAGRDTVLGSNVDGIFGERTEQYIAKLDEEYNKPTTTAAPTTQPVVPVIPDTTQEIPTTHYPVTQLKRQELPGYINEALQYIRPHTREDLDPTQLYGEMYALATNQLDPVQAQLYRPLLEQPYDISLQDQLNANQADFNAIQRQTGYNPAASAILAGQKYAANSKVLADQFRLNQEEKAGVYNRNRGTLNQAQLQNLGILDQQMVRQETAKSRTKDVAQAALNSISDKIMKNKLDNRTLSIYENMYNYRFDKNGRAINMNPIFQPSIPNVLPVYDNSGRIVGYQQTSTTDITTVPPIATTNTTTTQRYGGKTPSSRNRDLVRAIKGL